VVEPGQRSTTLGRFPPTTLIRISRRATRRDVSAFCRPSLTGFRQAPPAATMKLWR